MQKLEDMIRTYNSKLDEHIDLRVPAKHPLIRYIVDNAASVCNCHICSSNGGQRSAGKLCESGEKIFDYVPKRLRSKMDLRSCMGTSLEFRKTLPKDLWRFPKAMSSSVDPSCGLGHPAGGMSPGIESSDWHPGQLITSRSRRHWPVHRRASRPSCSR